jgi:methionyl-tRNA synthetase
MSDAETNEKISFDDFKKVDLRVATVLEAERVEGTDKLMKLQIDLGDEKRQIVAGIAAVYRPDTLVGKNIIVVANLAPVTLRGVESNGMLLAANIDGRPELATFDRIVKPGIPGLLTDVS